MGYFIPPKSLEPPRWKVLKHLSFTKDKLAFRQFILEHEGLETLQNVIYGDHDRTDNPHYTGLR